ncbi:IPT/TIG domain-containing protein [Kribbella sp. NPDC049174]|uniref:IPT/TIG domain-containing protein n=1 Tax=Kribbella sp. NPDC049174 TaxID=3364112 RepID=UPI00371D00E2
MITVLVSDAEGKQIAVDGQSNVTLRSSDANNTWRFGKDNKPKGDLNIKNATVNDLGRYTSVNGGKDVESVDLIAGRGLYSGSAAKGWTFIIVGVVILVLTILAVVASKPGARSTATPDDVRNWAVALAIATLVFAGAVYSGLVKFYRTDRGFFSLFVGTDRRTSTSRTQLLLWTLLVAFALAFIGATSLLSESAHFQCAVGDLAPRNCIVGSSWDAYLILIGLPATSAVVASGIVATKVSNGEQQKTTSTGTPKVGEVATADNGDVDIIDVQYLVFNLIAWLYVATRFIQNGVLPEVPAILLGLTGAAAGAYVLNKGLQDNKPVITSVAPGTIAVGTTVTVWGQNFVAPGAIDNLVTVKIGGTANEQELDTTGTRLVFKAPAGMTAGTSAVSVVTRAGVETAQYPVTIVDLPAP